MLCADRLRLVNDLFQCQICSNKHHFPREGLFFINSINLFDLIKLFLQKGLATNLVIQNLLLLKPIEISRTKSVNSFKITLKSLRLKLDRYKSDLSNGKDRIQEYCIDLRTDINLCTELIIERINKLSDELLKEINDYEKECVSTFENKNKKDLIEMIQTIEDFYLKWNCDVNKFDISDHTFNEANQTGLKVISQIEDELSNLDEFIFDGNRLKFVRNPIKIESDFLGSLVTEKTSFQSDILSAQQSKDLIKLCNFSKTSKWNLLYRASSDGFSASSFHSKCEGIKNTLTIIKSINGNIFGGYTVVPWSLMGGYKSDLNAFLFSLVNKDNEQLILKCIEPHRAIQLSSQHLVVFGGNFFRTAYFRKKAVAHGYILFLIKYNA